MDELIQIFSQDVKIYSTLISNNLFLESFLASGMDPKTGPTLIPDRVVETTMDTLLTQYFTSHGGATPTWTIHLCIGQREEPPEEKLVVKKESQDTQSIHKKQLRSRKKIKKEPMIIKVYIFLLVSFIILILS